MTGYSILKAPAALVTAGILAVALLAGCDDAGNEQTAAGQTEERAPGASVQAIKGGKQAQLTLNIDPQGYLFIEGRHRFTQTRVFTEAAGVGVTLTRGKVCVSYGKECVEAEVAYRVNAGEELALQKHYVATETLPDEATIEYRGIDDNGNQVVVAAAIQLEIPKQESRE